jgi:methyl-accepting chemotaxis protein
MTTPQNPFATLADMSDAVQRSQRSVYEAFDAWSAIAQSVGAATGSQAKNLRQILHGVFDLADQAFTVEREVANYLTIASRVAAATADSCRELTDIGLASLEAVTQVAGRAS